MGEDRRGGDRSHRPSPGRRLYDPGAHQLRRRPAFHAVGLRSHRHHRHIPRAHDAQFRRDLAAKIKRSQRGTISQKRAAAGLAYGYRKANRFDDRGELIRGLREIDEEQGKVVRRIFEEFAAGQSPRAIAERLNRDGIQSPGGRLNGPGFWRASTIYGDRKQERDSRTVSISASWFSTAPARRSIRGTRTHLIRANPEKDWLVEKVPELRIVDDDLWERGAACAGPGAEHSPAEEPTSQTYPFRAGGMRTVRRSVGDP